MTAVICAGVFLLASWATVATFSAVRNGERLGWERGFADFKRTAAAVLTKNDDIESPSRQVGPTDRPVALT